MTAPALRRGAFVATDLSSGLRVARDRFRIRSAPGGWTAGCHQTVFGSGLPTQSARLAVDASWRPRSLRVRLAGLGGVRLAFGPDGVRVDAREAGTGRRRIRLPLDPESAFPLVSGGLSFPFFLVRRLRAAGGRRLTVLVVPEGFCDLAPARGADREIDLSLRLPQGDDRLRLKVDEAGDLLCYHARNAGLFVCREGASPC